MKKASWQKTAVLLGSCVILLQATGCTFTEINSSIQTVLLGISAAGAIAILRNI